MRFTSVILSICAFAFMLCVGCAPKTIPPDIKPVYTANEVLMRVGELQDTVIALHDANPQGITKENADYIVRFTVSTAIIIQSSMSGWQATVKASWNELKQKYTPTEPKLLVIWNLTDVMIQSLTPGVQ